MSPTAWAASSVVLGILGLFAFTNWPPHLILLGGLTALIVGGVIEPSAALAGFSNQGLITVAALFVVAAGLRQTGVLAYVVELALGSPRSDAGAQARLVPPVVAASAFMNNTPLVAMLMPVVSDWCKAKRIDPSRVLLPLSYAAVLGGMCTLIGTSTNVIVDGLLGSHGMPRLGMFDITPVGLACAFLGSLFMLIAGRALLPKKSSSALLPEDSREYTVEMLVSEGGAVAGKTIEQAGLRRLPGLYLMEVQRGEHIIPAVDPGERLEAGDQLVFVGVVDSVVDLQRRPGLEAPKRKVFDLGSHRSERVFAEAVVSRSCPIIGRTIRDGRFRTRYNAVVLAVSRNGERIRSRIGDIVLRPGDALLLEALPSFVEQQRLSSDFYLVSRLEGASPPTTAQAPIALGILALMVTLAATGVLDMLQAAFLAAAAMLLARCCSEQTARASVDWPLLLSIGASFGLGSALEKTGAAQTAASAILAPAGGDPWLALALMYAATCLLTELITNNAAAVLMFPIALSTASGLGVSHLPFVIALMIAASAGFAMPLGYQTHLMVYGPGGYRLSDFIRIGVPMDLLMWVVTSLLTPLVFPF